VSLDDADLHYAVVAQALREGRVVPLLGAGVNLCGWSMNDPWEPGSSRLPSGAELADYLLGVAQVEGHIRSQDARDLVRVAQIVATVWGRAYLYDKLHAVFDADYEPTALHRFLARLPAVLRSRASPAPHQMIVSTNYDDSLERAFVEAGEPFDLLWYVADGARGRFCHWPYPQAENEPLVLERPNEYDGVSLAERTVILKFHGAVDRGDGSRDSYVITEDHYIEYLTRTHVAGLLPPELIAKLSRSHFLFLAYALRDWNVRVVLHRIWEHQKLDYASWAVQRDADSLDIDMWKARGVNVRPDDVDEYVHELARRLEVPL
jgi:hypothetical protein